MAYCKAGTSKNAVAALRYGEHEKDVVKSGVDCPDDTRTAEQLFKADRIMWQKEKGVQAHVIIQSFKPDEVSKEEANRIGQETVKQLAPGHRAMVYTHSEGKGGQVHNHIVISAVNHENGRKLATSNELNNVREISDGLCKEHGLSIIDVEKSRQDERRTMAERALIEKGEKPWKEEMREAVQEAFNNSHDIESFKEQLKERGITVSERMRTYQDKTKDLDFTYQDQDGHKCRAYKLGDDFTRRDVSRAFDLEKENAQEATRETTKAPENTKLQEMSDAIFNIREQRQNSILERADAAMDRYDAADAQYYLQEAKGILDTKHLVKIESPKNLQQAIHNGVQYMEMAAKLGNSEAQAFISNNGGSPEKCQERWELLTEFERDAIKAKNMYREDDYGDEEKSMMSGYKPKVREMELDIGFGR